MIDVGIPQVPPKLSTSRSPQLHAHAAELPINARRAELLKLVADNKCVLVVSPMPGAGLTTQVPQMLLQDCTATCRPCRIVAALPYRYGALRCLEKYCVTLITRILLHYYITTSSQLRYMLSCFAYMLS